MPSSSSRSSCGHDVENGVTAQVFTRGLEVDAYAFVDARFELLKKRAQLSDADHARGKVERLQFVCLQRETDVLTPIEVAAVVNVAALVAAELAELVAGGVRIRGVRRRLDERAAALAKLEAQRQAGREGGKKGGRPKKRPPEPTGSTPPETLGVVGGGKGGVYPELSPDLDLSTHQHTERGVRGENNDTPRVSIHGQFVAAFTELFRAANGGAKPSWGGKGGELVRKLLLEHGYEEAVRRARIMFESPPAAFPPAPRDLPTLVRFFDRFAQPVVDPKKNGHAPLGPEVEIWGRSADR